MHVFFFDIDGTLLSTGGAGKAAMEAGLMSAFGITEIRGFVPYSGRTDRAIGKDLLHLHNIEISPDHWRRLVVAYLSHLPTCLAQYRGQVLPGIISLLKHLVERNDVAVGLLTGNVREGARLKLGHYGLWQHFSFGGYGDHHLDRCDVAQEAWATARAHLGLDVQPEQIWIIGDTPLDVACARAIGARVAAVATGWHSFEELEATAPDAVFQDLAEPDTLLQITLGNGRG